MNTSVFLVRPAGSRGRRGPRLLTRVEGDWRFSRPVLPLAPRCGSGSGQKRRLSPGPEPRAGRPWAGEHGEDPPFGADRCRASHWSHDGEARLAERAHPLAPAWASGGGPRRQHAELGELEDRACGPGSRVRAQAKPERGSSPAGSRRRRRLDERSEQSPAPALRGRRPNGSGFRDAFVGDAEVDAGVEIVDRDFDADFRQTKDVTLFQSDNAPGFIVF